MNREFKSRVWDKKNKMMSSRIWAIHWDGVDKGIEVRETASTIKFEDAELMQYTGLKDKHGKEIYEGDIVKDKFGLLYDVRFGEFADTKWHVQSGFYLYDFADKISRGNMGYDADESCPLEVIGNIHENPELLAT